MKNYYAKKKVLITGAAGFIGSHLTDKLLGLGCRVIGVDNFLTGRKENISHLFGQEVGNYTFINADVVQSPITYLQQHQTLDLVFHLASPASPPKYQSHPVETYLVNSLGTHHLLDYIQNENPGARFIYASSSEVYGNPLKHPQKEDYWGNVNPNGPRSCYDEGKRMGETICGVFNRDFGVDVRIARIFNTYGPRIDPSDGRVVPNFIKQALAGKPLAIYGDGLQTRSYCYIDDLVDGLIALGESQIAAGETFNLGNPEEYTVYKTAQIIKKLTKTQSKFEHQPLPEDDPLRRKPSIKKAKSLLNWQPSVKFEEGLKKTIGFFLEKEAN
jgi:nucleoside-diphosphate-sugar epimerase